MSQLSREQRIRDGTLVPKSFQYPNMYIDWLSFYLTPEEEKVLNKAVREILGWRDKIADRRARIALSIFVSGKISRKTGEQNCLGCGLGLQSVRRALASLNEYKILVKEGSPTQDGQAFRIQDNANLIDWEGLATRRENWDKENAKRTRAATEASLESRGITSDVGGNVPRYPNPLGGTSDVTPEVACDVKEGDTSDVREEVTSDVNKETQKETQKEETKEKDSLSDLWTLACAHLRNTMLKSTYDAHLAGSQLLATDNGKWCLQVAQPRSVEPVQYQLFRIITKALATVSGEERDLEVVA